ncbi:hypothetical protein BCR39DRAFT_511310 [Naematelia encephala]|uniref:S-adenosyl-L-methionine-dependent methyltransferase n=1 Tax=Naematelia encephala TaxID=71784 RepID=A0A1Y2BLL5_9TREE|nr:hypothetical protein BCR39DRAFT_511310 [Naematelia encephala]
MSDCSFRFPFVLYESLSPSRGICISVSPSTSLLHWSDRHNMMRGVESALRPLLLTTVSHQYRSRSLHLPFSLPLPLPLCRSYATLSPTTPPPQAAYQVFDEPSKATQRDRAIARIRQHSASSTAEDLGVVDYLREEIAERLIERVEDLRVPPTSILDLSGHAGQLTRAMQEVLGEGISEEGIDTENEQIGKRDYRIVEPSGAALHRDPDDSFLAPIKRIQASPSELLAHPHIASLRDTVDCVVSGGGLHWVGDIVGCLTQIRHLLKQDGVFIGAVLGGDTLFELRTSLQLAEQERRGGIANRVSPMITPTDAPSLLNRAGFTLTTVDVEDLTVQYPSIWELMGDLRDMGESNAILGRRAQVSRDVLIAADAIYRELYGNEEGIPATFQIVWMIGWKPGPTEPKPLERGSAKTSLKDVL